MKLQFISTALAAAISGAMLVGAGCSSVDTAACQSLTTGTCPTSAPSYATDVQPILEAYCTHCHASGGEEADKPLSSYAAAVSLATSTQGEVVGCDMPPSDETQPTSAERQVILDWIACGEPQ